MVCLDRKTSKTTTVAATVNNISIHILKHLLNLLTAIFFIITIWTVIMAIAFPKKFYASSVPTFYFILRTRGAGLRKS